MNFLSLIRNNIRWRIGAPYVLLILSLTFILGLYLTQFVSQVYLRGVENELTAEARLLSKTPLLQDPSLHSSPLLNTQLAQWSQILEKRITLIAPDGTVVADSHYPPSVLPNQRSQPEILQAEPGGIGKARRTEHDGTNTYFLALPLKDDAGQIYGYLRLAIPLTAIQSQLSALQATLIGVAGLASLFAALLALWIAYRTTLPLRSLAQAVARMRQGSFEAQFFPATNDEIGQLTQQFNEMSAELSAKLHALEAERTRLATVLEVMSDGVLIVDRQGRVQLVNRAAQDMFGLPNDQTLGRTLLEALRHYQIADLWEHCRHKNETQTTLIEIPSRRLYLQGIATPLGEALGGSILLLFQDLTRLRRLETVRQDFISNISHELRTPLASLKALTETLQESALDDPPAAQRFLLRMRTEVDALSQMVEELLELSRIESGRVPLKMAATSPCVLINRAVERLYEQAQRAGLEITIHCSENLPPALADERRLEQVLVNLLHNAIKFTPAGGSIALSAYQEGEYILFSVQDNGIGIPAEELPRIFERFYKTDRARSSGGTGLGLAIARHLVEAHGGRIWAESVEGQGSTFTFSIPIAI